MSSSKQQASTREKLELVFVDTATPDYQQLLDAILKSNDKRTFKVHVIEHCDDGIDVISSTLSQYQNIDAIHVISRGADGSLVLGSTQVDLQYLNNFSGIFSSWSDAFTAIARVRLYGCDVASSLSGRCFVRTLARLTGTDVATLEGASDQASLGADWSFVYQIVAIEASLANSDLAPS